MAMQGVSEAVAWSKTAATVSQIRRYMFFPRLSGQAKDKANSLTETAKCHLCTALTATIAVWIA